MLARLKRFSFISIPNDRQFVKRVSEKNLMDLAILRGICSLQAEKTFFHGILGGRAAWRRVCGRAKLVALSCSFRVQLFGASPKPLFAPQTFREEPKRDSEFPPSLWGCEITSRSERIRQRCGRRRPCRSVRCRPDGSRRGCRRSLRPQHTGQESRCRFHPAPAHSR